MVLRKNEVSSINNKCVLLPRVGSNNYNNISDFFYRSSHTTNINGPVTADNLRLWNARGNLHDSSLIRRGTEGPFCRLNEFKSLVPEKKSDIEAELEVKWRKIKSNRKLEKMRANYRTVAHMQSFAPKLVKNLRWLWPREPRRPRTGLSDAQMVVVEAQRRVHARLEEKKQKKKKRKKMNVVARAALDAYDKKVKRDQRLRRKRLRIMLIKYLDSGFFRVNSNDDAEKAQKRSSLRMVLLFFFGSAGIGVWQAREYFKERGLLQREEDKRIQRTREKERLRKHANEIQTREIEIYRKQIWELEKKQRDKIREIRRNSMAQRNKKEASIINKFLQ
eukprot:g2282.t1